MKRKSCANIISFHIQVDQLFVILFLQKDELFSAHYVCV